MGKGVSECPKGRPAGIYGISPVTRQNGLARCKSRAFMANATTVARPVGLRPMSLVQSRLHRKCASHSSVRGLKRRTRRRGSAQGQPLKLELTTALRRARWPT